MIIVNANDGKKMPFTIEGTVLTMRDVQIDLTKRQGDLQRNVDVCLDGDLQQVREGIGAWYVANIAIPPRQYTAVETGEVDSNGKVVTTMRALPLDMSKVQMTLWGLPAVYAKMLEDEEGIN